jgi:hypothetical protein
MLRILLVITLILSFSNFSFSAPAKKNNETIYGLVFLPSMNFPVTKDNPDGPKNYLYNEFNLYVDFGSYKVVGYFYHYYVPSEPSESDWEDAQINVNKKAIGFGDNFLLTPFLTAGIPMSRGSKENTVQYSLGGSLNLALNTTALDIPELKLNYSLGYLKYFVGEELNSKGDPNISYRIRQRINFSYYFTEKISIFSRFQFDSFFDLDGEVNNSFLHYENLCYDLTENYSVYIGHYNANTLYHEETYESNLKIYDNSTSEFTLGGSFNFIF